MRKKKAEETGALVHKIWLEERLKEMEDIPKGDMVKDLVRISKDSFDTLRRTHGAGNLTDEARVSLISAAQVLGALSDAELPDLMPNLKPGLDLAVALVGSLATTGR